MLYSRFGNPNEALSIHQTPVKQKNSINLSIQKNMDNTLFSYQTNSILNLKQKLKTSHISKSLSPVKLRHIIHKKSREGILSGSTITYKDEVGINNYDFRSSDFDTLDLNSPDSKRNNLKLLLDDKILEVYAKILLKKKKWKNKEIVFPKFLSFR